MNENNSKSNFAKIIVVVVSIIVLGFSGTYAFFTTRISGTPTNTKATAATFNLTSSLEKANAINNAKLRMINASEKETLADQVTFTVTNESDSTLDAKYYIYLTDIILSKNLYSHYFKWELLQNNEIKASGNFENVTRKGNALENEAENVETEVEDIKLNTTPLSIEKNKTDNLIFRLWIENDPDVNQIELTEGKFRGKLYLEAVPKTE